MIWLISHTEASTDIDIVALKASKSEHNQQISENNIVNEQFLKGSGNTQEK